MVIKEKKGRYRAVYSFVISLSLFLICIWAANRGITKNIKDFVREDTLLSFCLILSLYAIKSFVPLIPLPVLYLATAHIFETGLYAFAVNVIGIAVSQTFPYLLGRADGKKILLRFAKRSETVMKAMRSIDKKPFLATLMSRLSPIIPKDIISLISGIARVSYPTYIVSSILGSLPGLVSVTILGRAIDDPFSPAFVFSLLFALITTAISYIIYKRTEI